MKKYLRYNQVFFSAIVLVLINPFFVSGQDAIVKQPGGSLKLEKINKEKTRNIIFILTDDHRFDALGFLKAQSFIQTPNLDKMAMQGAYLPNAFVTTALCSPSRASILTGIYAHKHKVVDNNNPVSKNIIFYPEYLQTAGYQTALIGKWHMGGDFDDPQRGFNHWVSFKGQGTYFPNPNGLNINGKKMLQKGYITDELTEYALDWLRSQKENAPFALYLSHKGIHSEFVPADRHKGKLKDYKFAPPASMDPAKTKDLPMWAQNQRNSWHGVDFPYHSDLDIEEYYKKYAETLMSVDESVGKIMDYLKENNLLESTLIIYMGDNGFQFGEHGLIDKRSAYEASMRVPMIAYAPGLIQPGTVVKEVVANIDVAPTFLEAAGLKSPGYMDGKSFLPFLKGIKKEWRKGLLYEYYWERNYPQTPTMHAIRGDRYKYIHYQGIWDIDELYDLQEDPDETKNLINSPEHKQIAKEMNSELFSMLKNTQGLYIPLYEDRGRQENLRLKSRSKEASFPESLMKEKAMLRN